MDAQSDETNKPEMESASHVVTAGSDNDCAAMISQSEKSSNKWRLQVMLPIHQVLVPMYR